MRAQEPKFFVLQKAPKKKRGRGKDLEKENLRKKGTTAFWKSPTFPSNTHTHTFVNYYQSEDRQLDNNRQSETSQKVDTAEEHTLKP